MGEMYGDYAEFMMDLQALSQGYPITRREIMEKIPMEETRVTSDTGGQKGSKPEQYDDIPVEALRALARVYAMGAAKYERGNYRKGYPWSLSFSAMMRHLWAWQGGEDVDPESGESHLMHAAWHCFTLFHFAQEHEAFDDRQ